MIKETVEKWVDTIDLQFALLDEMADFSDVMDR